MSTSDVTKETRPADDFNEKTILMDKPVHDDLFWNKPVLRITIFILTMVWLISDLVLDWSMYFSLIGVKRGLVFGPVHDPIVKCFLGFCIVNIFTSIMVLYNITKGEVYRKPLLDMDIMNLIAISFASIPQMVLYVLIAACQEVQISDVQFYRAILLLINSVFLNVISVTRFVRAEINQKITCLKRFIHLFLSLGVMILTTGAILIFLLTNLEPSANGAVKLRVQQQVTPSMKYERYFSNVGIFLNHPFFKVGCPNSADSWLKLTTIDDVRTVGLYGITTALIYTKFEGQEYVYMNSSSVIETKEYCYMRDMKTCLFRALNDCQTSYHYTSYAVTYTYKFEFEAPKDVRLGEIYFDAQLRHSTTCLPYSVATLARDEFGKLHYFRDSKIREGSEPMIYIGQTPNLRLFERDDLTDTQMAWRTGHMKCEPTGYLQPQHVKSLGIDC